MKRERFPRSFFVDIVCPSDDRPAVLHTCIIILYRRGTNTYYWRRNVGDFKGKKNVRSRVFVIISEKRTFSSYTGCYVCAEWRTGDYLNFGMGI